MSRALHYVVRCALTGPDGSEIEFVNTIRLAAAGLFGDDTGLDLDFDVHLHTRREPTTSTLTVRGLSRATRDALGAAFRAASALSFEEHTVLRAGRVVIEAGYRDGGAHGLLCEHEVLSYKDDSRTDEVTFTMQDGRVPWANSYVTEELGDADLSTVTKVLRGALQPGLQTDEDIVAALAANLPGYVSESGNVRGKAELSLTLLGATRRWQGCLDDALGLRSFFDEQGRPVTVVQGAATFDVAVVLSPLNTYAIVPLDSAGRGEGWLQVEGPLNFRLCPGRQAQVLDERGLPYRGGVFRVDAVSHSGRRRGGAWSSVAVLRQTALPS